MGFLDEYGINADQITAPTFERKLPAAGAHFFEVSEAVVRKGTRNQPNSVKFFIEYQLSDADGESTGSISEWFDMRDNGKVTNHCSEQLGWLDRRIKNLGFKGGLEDPEFTPDAAIGLRGRIEIVHNKSKKPGDDRVFANVKSVTVFEADAEDEGNEFATAGAEGKTSDAELWN